MKNETTKFKDEGKILVSDCMEVVTRNYNPLSHQDNKRYFPTVFINRMSQKWKRDKLPLMILNRNKNH